MDKKIGVFILCYNVEKTVQEVISSLNKPLLNKVHQLIVIDNSSTDGTRDIIKKFRKKNIDYKKKLILLSNKVNYGSGGSQKIAFEYSIKKNLTHCIIIHGDAQGDADKIINNFLKKLKEKPFVDFISASRFSPESDISHYSFTRKLGNIFFNCTTFLLTGIKMSDAGTGIILITTKMLKKIRFDQLDNFFHFNPQLNLTLHAKKNIQKEEVPLLWRDSDVQSNVKVIRYGLGLLKILFQYFIFKNFFKRSGWQLFYSKRKEWNPKYITE